MYNINSKQTCTKINCSLPEPLNNHQSMTVHIISLTVKREVSNFSQNTFIDKLFENDPKNLS